MLLAINDISLMFIGLAVMVLLFSSFFIALRNVQHKQKAFALLQKQKEETELQKQKLEQALNELKATQAQLVQRQKMASLGELTAGIAHEIQNPLNFVKNFSEVSTELADELNQELAEGNMQNIKLTAAAIKENLETIAYHSNRADSIIKSMMQHSRNSTGRKEMTDINSLADEYLRLSYQGFRAKDKSFNATIQTNFDDNMGEAKVIPQDVGRALLNLFSNAFYAVNIKKKHLGEGYEPTVWVRTKKYTDKVEINVRDNGIGIPRQIQDKIFQPFFTTKPTGQGTGLGLSLCYDIIKAHGGELQVDTKEGEFTEFKIQLPFRP